MKVSSALHWNFTHHFLSQWNFTHSFFHSEASYNFYLRMKFHVNLCFKVKLHVSHWISLALRVKLHVSLWLSLPLRVKLHVSQWISLALRVKLHVSKWIFFTLYKALRSGLNHNSISAHQNWALLHFDVWSEQVSRHSFKLLSIVPCWAIILNWQFVSIAAETKAELVPFRLMKPEHTQQKGKFITDGSVG
jgi:hypothetical protein